MSLSFECVKQFIFRLKLDCAIDELNGLIKIKLFQIVFIDYSELINGVITYLTGQLFLIDIFRQLNILNSDKAWYLLFYRKSVKLHT